MNGSKIPAVIKSGLFSINDFPIQNDGKNEIIYAYFPGMKYGATEPNIVIVESFVTAIPSSLLEEKAVTRSATIIPSSAVKNEVRKIIPVFIFVRLNIGRRTAVITNEIASGITSLEKKYPVLPSAVIKR